MAMSFTLTRDTRVIGLISLAHMLSHMYTLVLPPLFPILKEQFQVSYVELGLVVTCFGVASGVLQTPIGFIVDKIGGRPVLIAGLLVESLAIALIGVSDAYWHLLVLFTVAGIANCVFHPCDYAIMSSVISPTKLGRAFSFHSFTGNLAWAFTPALMVFITALWNWRMAFLVIGGIGVLYALYMATQSSMIDDANRDGAERNRQARERAATASGASPASASARSSGGLALLLSAPVMMCTLFYLMTSMGLGGLKTFFVATMDTLYGTPLTILNLALSGLMLGTALGILMGGVVADRFGPRRITGVLTLGTAGALIVVIGAVPVPAFLLIAILIASGVLQGLLGPTRDLVVRAVTPSGQTGKVFGFVSSGQSLGSALMPPLFGLVLDHGEPRMIFWLSAAMIAAALFTFLSVKGMAVPKEAAATA